MDIHVYNAINRYSPIMGSSDEYIEMILTCKGDYYDPTFHSNLDNFSTQLQELITKGLLSYQVIIVISSQQLNSISSFD